jgi:DNA ligase-associated metallophosphoesterase
MTEPCRITVFGEELVLDPSGAAWWAAQKTLIVADLHFEKGSAYARSGQFLPPYDTRATIRKLEALWQKFGAQRLIALGDSFHDDGAASRLDLEERSALSALTKLCDVVWVEGNHDPNPPQWLGGRVMAELVIGNFVFRHIPRADNCVGEIAGHLHPAARLSRGGMRLWKRCFVTDYQRLVMPSFGAYTGGLDVRDAAVTEIFRQGFGVYALGREKVYLISPMPVAKVLV